MAVAMRVAAAAIAMVVVIVVIVMVVGMGHRTPMSHRRRAGSMHRGAASWTGLTSGPK
jgi:hypothetical protein